MIGASNNISHKGLFQLGFFDTTTTNTMLTSSSRHNAVLHTKPAMINYVAAIFACGLHT
jgi:hypothetical protein